MSSSTGILLRRQNTYENRLQVKLVRLTQWSWWSSFIWQKSTLTLSQVKKLAGIIDDQTTTIYNEPKKKVQHKPKLVLMTILSIKHPLW